MHQNTLLILEKYARTYFQGPLRVLEIGPDDMPSEVQKLLGNDTMTWHTLNLRNGEDYTRAKNDRISIIADDEYRYPIEDGVYDVVISTNVAEHVRKLWKWYPELCRVLKPGGHVITVSPISWPYHEAPVDCWRIYPEGIRAVYEDSGLTDVFSTFESVEIEKNGIPSFMPLMPWATTSNTKKLFWQKGYNRFLRIIPFSKPLMLPVAVAYDLFTVARK